MVSGKNSSAKGQVRSRKSGEPPPMLLQPDERELCTMTLRRFLKRHHAVFDFFFFGIHLAVRTDEMRMTAAKALASVGREKDVENLKRTEEDPKPAQDKLNSFGDLQSENIVIRLADNFLSFLSELIQEAFLRRPEMLRSEEKIRLDDVLRFSRYSDLTAFLVDRKINELSYGGIGEVEKFLQQRTGLSLFESEEEKTLLVLVIELRNIYSHSRGVVSETTLRRVANLETKWQFEKGKKFGVGYDEIVALANNLMVIARRLDAAFAEKFRIRRKRLGPPPSNKGITAAYFSAHRPTAEPSDPNAK